MAIVVTSNQFKSLCHIKLGGHPTSQRFLETKNPTKPFNRFMVYNLAKVGWYSIVDAL